MKIQTLESLKKNLEAPGKELRSAPFWGWNGKIEEADLEFQMNEMKEQGMGGCFIHSREGLETEYLSEEWMDRVAFCVEQAKNQDLELWIYDEDKWPSGCAGGMVSASNPEKFTAKGLTLEILDKKSARAKNLTCGEEQEDGKVLYVLPATIRGNVLEQYGVGESVIVLRRERSATSEWYNGYAPTDNLNPEAVQKFLEITHERYRERIGEEFGKTVKGFFTDEPNCYDFYSLFTKGRPWLPWTDEFLDYFEAHRGYNPLKGLPLLFFWGKGCAAVRHDYWRTVSELFGESYMKQLYEWCDAHRLGMTGHVLYENDLGYQIRVCGAAMPQYRYMHHPGIDILGDQTKEYLTVKQCTSVANQYDREMVLTETYGCTGWEFDFEGQKALGDWQFVLGVTRRCQHLMQYSIAGCRKRDYPPVFNYQTTWWKDNYRMEDYFARLTACVSTGAVVRDLLVIHPISSLWTLCGSDPSENLENIEMNMGWLDEHITSLNKLGEDYNRLAKMLLGIHQDFDFGDETILAEEAFVEKGVLHVGACSYHTVIVPRVCSLFQSTLQLLKEFAATGGSLYWTGAYPSMIEGRKTEDQHLEAFFEGISMKRVDTYEALIGRLAAEQPGILQVCTKNGEEDAELLTMLRRVEDSYVLFAVNNDRKNTHPVRIRFARAGRVTAHDLWNDTKWEVPTQVTAEGMEFIDEFAPAKSLVYIIECQKEGLHAEVAYPYVHPHYTEPVFAALGPVAKVTRTEENVLTLDRCRYRLWENRFSGEMEVWQAQKEMREALSMQQIYYNGAPQRYRWIYEPHEKNGTPFALEFRFRIRELPENDTWVVIEKPEKLSITCNGVRAGMTGGYFHDRDMKRVLLPGLTTGENILTISGAYETATELEDIFIIGDFAVNPSRELERETGRLHFGDWCFQGYYHYAGSMRYHFTLPDFENSEQRIILKMGDYRGTFARITVNGAEAGILQGNAYRELDITDYLKEKGNTCDIEVAGSPRNMFGPFHQAYTGCSRISWADFRTEGKFYCDGYVLQPYGLMGQITCVAAETKQGEK